MDVYYIGGSPGSGKSTIANKLSKEYGFAYYKLDDFLFRYMKKAARDGMPHSRLARSLDQEQTWMREPRLQADEEFAIYREIFPYALSAIEKLRIKKPVIAEGAGFTPELMAEQGVPSSRYLCIVPTEDFQRGIFEKRTWAKLFLRGCHDPAAAFENWMRRDVLFAKEALWQAQSLGYTSIVVDGSKSIAEHEKIARDVFGLA